MAATITKSIIGYPKRALRACYTLYSECRASAREAHGLRSRLQLCGDFALSRLIRYTPRRIFNRVRQVDLRNGVTLRYRLNRGDIQSIREIWLERAYRLPFPI